MIFTSITFYFVSVTTEFPSTLPIAEGTRSGDTFLMAEDVPTAGEEENAAKKLRVQRNEEVVINKSIDYS